MKKDYIVKQHDSKDCGICSLLSIIKYYHGYIPLETLRLETNTSRNGTTALNLVKAAQKYGFTSYGIKVKNIDEKNIILPAIAHIITKKGLNHFVVIYKITKKYVFIMDPDKGYQKKLRKDFFSEWTNIILIFKPLTKIPYYKEKNILQAITKSILKDNIQLLIKIFVLSIIITFLSIISSYYLKIAIDGIESNQIAYLKFIIILFLIINIIKIIFDYLKNEITIYLSKNIDLRIVPDFLYHIFNLPTESITSRSSGEILKRVTNLNNVKDLFSSIIITTLLNLILIIISSIFLFNLRKDLFLILCIISILYIIIGRIEDPLIREKINKCLDYEAEYDGTLTEKIDNIESLKNLSMINKTLDKVNSAYAYYVSSLFKFNNLENKFSSLKKAINILGIFIIESYGLYLIFENKLTLIILITFTSLIEYFLNPLEEIIDLIPKYRLIELSIEKVKSFLNIELENEGKLEKFENGNIVIKNLTFSYDRYEKILDNFNLTINKNDRILLKGESGCGKSTICKILSKTIKEYQGQIEVNGINLKDYSLKTIRNNILYVSQRERINSDTIKNNICLNQKINLKELNEVLKITKVDEIVSKKELRLETFLFDSGFNLSGGEKQRIILARSIIRKPKILILDESLSEIEEDMEEEILTSVSNYLKDTTIIYISHKSKKIFKKVVEIT